MSHSEWRRDKLPRHSHASLYSLTTRTRPWQDKGVGHAAALECCPKIPSLLIIRHPLYFMETEAVCVTSFQEREREREKLGPNYLFSLVFALAVYSHHTGNNTSQQPLLHIGFFWHSDDSVILHG